MTQLPPEIVSRVVENFAGSGFESEEDVAIGGRDLLACMQVDRTWFYEAARVLWRNQPDLHSVLSHIEQKSRLQLYSGFVDRLYIEDDASDLEELVGYGFSNFGKLRELEVSSEVIDDKSDVIDNFLVPSLERLSIYSGIVDGRVLDKIQRKCPKLKEFNVGDDPNYWPLQSNDAYFAPSPHEFARFVEQLPLKDIQVNSEDLFHCLEPETSLPALMVKSTLESLSLPSIGQFEMERATELAGEGAFKSIKRLNCKGIRQGIWGMIKNLSNLEHLSMTVTTDLPGMLRLIGESCPKLKELVLSYSDRRQLICPFTELAAVSYGAPNLQVLKIFANDDMQLSDETLINFAKHASNLKELNLQISVDNNKLSHRSIQSLGDNCRQLEVFKYKSKAGSRMDFEHSQIEVKNPPLFPNLRIIEPLPCSSDDCSCFTDFAYQQMPLFAESQGLCRHALCDLHQPSDDDEDSDREAVQEAMLEALRSAVETRSTPV